MTPKYKQKFRLVWLDHFKLKGWVAQDEMGPEKGFCKYCMCTLGTKLCDLIYDGETKKHKATALLRNSCWRKLDFQPQEIGKTKKPEIALLFLLANTPPTILYTI